VYIEYYTEPLCIYISYVFRDSYVGVDVNYVMNRLTNHKNQY
jgi:hypothetical protein